MWKNVAINFSMFQYGCVKKNKEQYLINFVAGSCTPWCSWCWPREHWAIVLHHQSVGGDGWGTANVLSSPLIKTYLVYPQHVAISAKWKKLQWEKLMNTEGVTLQASTVQAGKKKINLPLSIRCNCTNSGILWILKAFSPATSMETPLLGPSAQWLNTSWEVLGPPDPHQPSLGLEADHCALGLGTCLEMDWMWMNEFNRFPGSSWVFQVCLNHSWRTYWAGCNKWKCCFKHLLR